MLIAKLTASFDRGLATNTAEDLGLDNTPEETKDGGLVRGLGTHFRSEADKKLVREREAEFTRIRNAFRRRFLVTPIDGLYLTGRPGDAKEFLKSLDIRDDIEVRVTEFQLAAYGQLPDAELSEWAKRVKSQLVNVPLGRGNETDEAGLAALETLVSCPVVGKDTVRRVKELIGMVRNEKLDRLELKRSLVDLKVDIEPTALSVQPRRAPVAQD